MDDKADEVVPPCRLSIQGKMPVIPELFSSSHLNLKGFGQAGIFSEPDPGDDSSRAQC